MHTLQISCSAIHEHYSTFPDAEHYRRFCTENWLESWTELYGRRRLKGYEVHIVTPQLKITSHVTRVTMFDVLKMRPTLRLYFAPHKPGDVSHIDISMLHCRPIFLGKSEIMLSMWNHGLATLRPRQVLPVASCSEM